LYVVATPIGNLEDISARAVRILGEVDFIACEDSRQTRKLLDRYGIATRLVSYHEHNEQSRVPGLLAELRAGKNIAIVSDAGTPLIADPGYRVVEQARAQGIAVSPIPGPSALVTALSASGLATDAFLFHGFLPPKKGQRTKLLEKLKPLESTLVFYEAPHRILEALEDIGAVLGERQVVLGRELTKIHEEFLRGTPSELRSTLQQRPSVKGEFTVMVARASPAEADDSPLDAAVEKLIQAGVPRMEAFKTVARNRGLSKREVYKKFNER
jgi:16S rRNA (cytidine1402-2'-O)-methyltransferase